LNRRPVFISAALTLAFVAWLWHAGWLSQWQTQLQRVPATLWGVMVLGMLCSYGLRAWRISREFGEVPGMRWTLALRIVLAHTALVNVLPMRSGELGFPWLMRRALNVGWLDAAASLMWLRLQDACVLATLAIWAWPGWPAGWRMGLTLALGLALGLGVRWIRQHGQNSNQHEGAQATRLATLTRALSRRGQNMTLGWLITISNWLLKLSLQAWLLAQLLALPWAQGWAGSLGAELSALLPVQGLGGLGSYEAGAAAALRWQGVAWMDGLQAALSMHLAVLACSLGFGLLAWWLPRPLLTRHNPK
jgi:hypothetical protein